MDVNDILGEANNAAVIIRDNVPEYVKKGFLKAVNHLGSAIVDIGIAKLEGYAQDIRAQNNSRSTVISAVGNSIASKIDTNQAYSDFAVEKYTRKILRQQVNIDAISFIAANELSNLETGKNIDNDSEISDEWLNEFEDVSRLKSSEDMRVIFGKILASEIYEPGKFSVRTLRIVSQLDRKIAEKFLKLCSLCISTIVDGKIISAIAPSFNSGPLQVIDLSEFGIGYNDVTDLVDYGLVLPKDDLELSFSTCIMDENGNVGEYIWFDNKKIIIKIDEHTEITKDVSTHGIWLTNAGIDLYSILDFPYNQIIYTKLSKYLQNKGFELTCL